MSGVKLNKAQQILNLFYPDMFSEDFTSSGDQEKAKSSKRARASRQGWMKHRNKYISGIERNVRLKQMFSGKSTFLTQLRKSIKKVKTELRRRKMKELSKKNYLDKFKFNLFDSEQK